MLGAWGLGFGVSGVGAYDLGCQVPKIFIETKNLRSSVI